MPITTVKQHAPSFPHLPTIFHEAVPILLHPARTAHPTPVSLSPPRLADRDVPDSELTRRDHRLAELAPQPRSTTPPPWPEAVATAWRAVTHGTPAEHAAADLWPHYLARVRGWLAHASTTSPSERPHLLYLAMNHVLTALTRNRHLS
ncbi:hypothetical protein [Actinopolyspora mortivallis]|uniref:hypothetical protein n=1 Tax=Actinopolyspora mortivallis TaxID=33906 RepID=UPI0015E5CC22|nr:hypothetical protein [Actinopolyspora mortivallis]